jgi:hypothetical protein
VLLVFSVVLEILKGLQYEVWRHHASQNNSNNNGARWRRLRRAVVEPKVKPTSAAAISNHEVFELSKQPQERSYFCSIQKCDNSRNDHIRICRKINTKTPLKDSLMNLAPERRLNARVDENDGRPHDLSTKNHHATIWEPLPPWQQVLLSTLTFKGLDEIDSYCRETQYFYE